MPPCTELPLARMVRQKRGHREAGHYTIHPNLPLPDQLANKNKIRDLLAILTTQDPPPIDPARIQPQHPEHAPGP